MTHLRLRTQLFVATLLTICGLTGALLLIIRHTVSVETNRQVRDGTEESVRAFESVQRQWERQLSSMAAMLADLPTLKALMTTEHALTIQDGSTTYWKLAGSDLFVLAKADRQIVALHVTNPGWPTEAAERDLKRSMEQGDDASMAVCIASFSAASPQAREATPRSSDCWPSAIRSTPVWRNNWRWSRGIKLRLLLERT
jgi:hypothetical protein